MIKSAMIGCSARVAWRRATGLRSTAVLALVLCTWAAPTRAGEEPPPVETQPGQPEGEGAVAEPGAPLPDQHDDEREAEEHEAEAAAPTTEPGHLSMDFVAADLVDVVKAISVQSGIDVVVAGDVRRPVTVHLSNKPLETTLRLIASANRLAFREVEGAYVIGTREAIEESFPTGLVTQVIEFAHAPTDLLAGIVAAAHPDAHVVPHPEKRMLVVSGSEESLVAVRKLVADLDAALPPPAPPQPVEQPKPASTSAVYRAKHVSLPMAKALIERLGVGVELTLDEQFQVLTLRGAPEQVEQARQILKEIDAQRESKSAPEPPKEAPVTAPLLLTYVDAREAATALSAVFGKDVTATAVDERNLLITGPNRWVTAAVETAERLDAPPLQVVVDVALVSLPEELPPDLAQAFERPATAGAAPSGATRVSTRPLADILALVETAESAAVLSQSRLTTVEGVSASLFAGERRPTSQDHDAGETGLRLEVTPRVDSNSAVSLDLAVTLSAIAGQTPDGRPVLATREAKSSLRLRSGQTVLVDGVMTSREIEEFRKTPILGHLPFFGLFFTKHRVEIETANIALLLSAVLVRE